jgi:RNA polymerase sigma-70 factor (ECF subfamily)
MEDPVTDNPSIARLQRGDLAGLDALIARYQLRATRAAYLIVRDRPLAEDIVQNAFVRLPQTIRQFDIARPFAPWFLRCVVNDALKALRKQKRQVSLDAATDADTAAWVDYLTDPCPKPEALAETAETRQAVWDALARLAPEQRAAIVQRYYLGLSEAEMSTEMQRPAGTVKWLLHAAREKLRTLLAAHAPAAPGKEREA